MKRWWVLVLMGLVTVTFTAAADLVIDAHVSLGGTDRSADFVSIIGSLATVDHDHVDAVSGASQHAATPIWIGYGFDVKGARTFPAGLWGLLLFGAASTQTLSLQAPQLVKNTDGSFTIQYEYAGIAYEMTTDLHGALELPTGLYRSRVVGTAQPGKPDLISADFSTNGTAAGLQWSKVWDPGVPSGATIGGLAGSKTGPIRTDAISSRIYSWQGFLQITPVDAGLNFHGEFNAVSSSNPY